MGIVTETIHWCVQHILRGTSRPTEPEDRGVERNEDTVRLTGDYPPAVTKLKQVVRDALGNPAAKEDDRL